MSNKVYMVVYSDESGDLILPDEEFVPRALYMTVADALEAANKWIATFERWRPVLYGQAYPYESTSLNAEVEKKGAGPLGWVIYEDEDGDKSTYTVQILAMELKA